MHRLNVAVIAIAMAIWGTAAAHATVDDLIGVGAGTGAMTTPTGIPAGTVTPNTPTETPTETPTHTQTATPTETSTPGLIVDQSGCAIAPSSGPTWWLAAIPFAVLCYRGRSWRPRWSKRRVGRRHLE